MNQTEFVKLALDRIPNDPLDRLDPKTRAIVQNPKVIFDAHCHIFDRKTVPVWYLLIRLRGDLPNLIKSISSNKNVSKVKGIESLQQDIEWIYQDLERAADNETSIHADTALHIEQDIVKVLDKQCDEIEEVLASKKVTNAQEIAELESLNRGIEELVDALGVVLKNSMGAVYKMYNKRHAIHNIVKDQDGSELPFAALILMMDLETGWIPARKSILSQVNELNELATEQPILPFFPIDPRRAHLEGNDNLFHLFLKAFAEKDSRFFGVKVYPSLGFLPSHPDLSAIFAVCEKKKIPVVTHCGSEMISSFRLPVHTIRSNANLQWEHVTISGTRTDVARQLNDPAEWQPVIDRYPNLHLNIGHFGPTWAWENSDFSNNQVDPRVQTIVDMLLRKDRNVYADFSFNLIDPTLNDKFVDALKKIPELGKKVMFGTDYWVVLPSGDLNMSQQDFVNKMNSLGFKDAVLRNNILKYLNL